MYGTVRIQFTTFKWRKLQPPGRICILMLSHIVWLSHPCPVGGGREESHAWNRNSNFVTFSLSSFFFFWLCSRYCTCTKHRLVAKNRTPKVKKYLRIICGQIPPPPQSVSQSRENSAESFPTRMDMRQPPPPPLLFYSSRIGCKSGYFFWIFFSSVSHNYIS